MPSHPGNGLPTTRNRVPTSVWNPSGRPPCPVEVHRGTSTGSVSAFQTTAGACRYSRTIFMSPMPETPFDPCCHSNFIATVRYVRQPDKSPPAEGPQPGLDQPGRPRDVGRDLVREPVTD